jgi:hypothetical protein
MRLLFDDGSLVLVEAPDVGVASLPGVTWDARVGLFRAPAFRHGDVLDALVQRGLPVRDEVVPPERGAPAAFRAIELRPYQQAAVTAWETAGHRGLVVLPTGSGKTRVATAILATSKARALCLVPTRALLRQWLAELARIYDGPLGCLGDGVHRVEALTVSTFASAHRYMPRLGNAFELLVVDEAHHFGLTLRDEALEKCVARKRLGLTATPPEGDALRRLETLLGPVVYTQSVPDLAGKWLADFEVVVIPLGLEPDERARYQADHRVLPTRIARFAASIRAARGRSSSVWRPGRARGASRSPRSIARGRCSASRGRSVTPWVRSSHATVTRASSSSPPITTLPAPSLSSVSSCRSRATSRVPSAIACSTPSGAESCAPS